MCGIVGFIGEQEAAPILLEGLARMEYRGYDSAGLAVLDAGKGLQVVKAKGRLKVLNEKVDGGKKMFGTVGVGHTRWATHGEPSDANSHPHAQRVRPHRSGAQRHHRKLHGDQRVPAGTRASRSTSETDTEVVAQLLDYYYRGQTSWTPSSQGAPPHRRLLRPGHRLRRASRTAHRRPEGQSSDAGLRRRVQLHGQRRDRRHQVHPGRVLHGGRRDRRPDPPDGIQVYNILLEPVEKEHSTVDWDISAAEKGGYEHFMFKEIMEQPEAIRKTISPRIKDGRVVLDDHRPERRSMSENIYQILHCRLRLLATMWAWWASMSWRELLRKPVEVALASEFRYC